MQSRANRATRKARDQEGQENARTRRKTEHHLAAKRSTSISGLLTIQIEQLAGEEDDYERAKRGALTLMEEGFHLGGTHTMDREALHER